MLKDGLMTLTAKTFAEILSSLGVGKQDILILGISGGADSVVAAHLLHAAGYRALLAHVNYGLRGEESDGDEQFVRQLSAELEIPLHVLKTDAAEFFGESGSAIQQKARELRYQWFRELKAETGAAWIVVAHHSDDQTETVIHQFVRGGGLKSLTGMAKRRGNIIRPLLGFSAGEIRSYAAEHRLTWRSDSSNENSDYTRNYIRNEIIPLLRNVNPALDKVFARRAELLMRTSQYLSEKLTADLKDCYAANTENRLSLKALTASEFPDMILWHWLEPYGLSSEALPEVVKLLSSQTGSHLEFGQWIIWKEHDEIYLQDRNYIWSVKEVLLEEPGLVQEVRGLCLTEVSENEVFFTRDAASLFVDAAKVVWPVLVRAWKSGDRFVPCGFDHEKKLSDFFMQEKIPVHQRTMYPVLISSEKIIAIAGLRIDHSMRIEPTSRRFLRIDYMP
jgi:tRNA(Ile)-lysidine synthase